MDERLAAKLDSRALISVTGAHAASFLQGLISNDVEEIRPDRAIYAALLTPQGKFLFEFFVAAGEDGLVLDVDRARRGDLIKRLHMYKLRAKVEIADRAADFEIMAVWGGAPVEAAPGPFAQYRDPRLEALGRRLAVPSATVEGTAQSLSAKLVAEAEYHRRRIQLGVPDGPMDLEPEQTFLLEGNFEELYGVDFKKGCYVGQELTARMKHRGTARRRMLPVRGSAKLPAAGTAITDESGRDIGDMRGSIDDSGMAAFRLDRLKEARQLQAEGVKLEVLRPAYSVIGWEETPS